MLSKPAPPMSARSIWKTTRFLTCVVCAVPTKFSLPKEAAVLWFTRVTPAAPEEEPGPVMLKTPALLSQWKIPPPEAMTTSAMTSPA